MWLAPFFTNNWAQDVVATVLTFAVALAWLRLMDALAARGVIGQSDSRKLIHIGTGPIFVLCWNLFSPQPAARYLAALVPLAITAQVALVGSGVIKDPAAVQAMSRTGDRREILRGPLYYGIVFILCTLVFWRTSPVGFLALMLMCGGDGLADLVGRRWGKTKLPFNASKSWVGCLTFLLAGFAFACAFVALFNVWGVLDPRSSLPAIAWKTAVIAAAATIVEALPLRDIDNLTTTVTAVVLGLLLF
jgi:phytol kinase